MELGDRVTGPGERPARAHEPPDADSEGQAAGHDRRIVDETPTERLVPRYAARRQRQDEDYRDQPHPERREEIHPPVLSAVVPWADLELVANAPAQEDRDHVGDVEA